MKKLIISLILGIFSTVALADNVVVTQTKSWKSVPIVVNDGAYVVEGPVPTGNYYYAYSGHRCFQEKRDIVGINAIVVKAKISGGSDIYCYPE